MLIRSRHRTALLLAAAIALAAGVLLALRARGAAPPAEREPPAVIRAVADDIDGERLHGDVAFLADDMLEGRGTGTRGYDLAARYVANRFATLGLEPGGEAGGYLQQVPFRCGNVVEASSSLALLEKGALGGKAGKRPLALAQDATLGADLLRAATTVEAPLLWVGYGVSAPELGHDDFAGVDATGKVLVEVRGAPPRFDHDQRAFYSSSRMKDEMAAEHGAVGLLGLTKPSEAARSPWPRSVRQSRLPACKWIDDSGRPVDTQERLQVLGSLSRQGVDAVFAGSPVSFDEAIAAAEASRPRSFALATTLAAHRETRQSEVKSPNVVGVLRGADPALAGEAVVISAHLDHLGISEPVKGDTINNGAYDNASGTAIMMELARAFRIACERGSCPRRSLIFLANTGEEKGLQGADYFAPHAAPAGLRVVGDVNLDEVLMLRPITSVIAFGAEHTSLGPTLERAAAMTGLHVVPDPVPQEVIFVRSDQFPFIRRGIPAIFPVSAMDGGPEAAAASETWDKEVYHSPADDMSQVFDWASGARFARMAFLTTWMVADADRAPSWNEGDFFAKRFAPAAGPRR